MHTWTYLSTHGTLTLTYLPTRTDFDKHTHTHSHTLYSHTYIQSHLPTYKLKAKRFLLPTCTNTLFSLSLSFKRTHTLTLTLIFHGVFSILKVFKVCLSSHHPRFTCIHLSCHRVDYYLNIISPSLSHSTTHNLSHSFSNTFLSVGLSVSLSFYLSSVSCSVRAVCQSSHFVGSLYSYSPSTLSTCRLDIFLHTLHSALLSPSRFNGLHTYT